MPRLTDTDRDEIVKLGRSIPRVSVLHIANLYGVSRQAVYDIIQNHEVIDPARVNGEWVRVIEMPIRRGVEVRVMFRPNWSRDDLIALRDQLTEYLNLSSD